MILPLLFALTIPRSGEARLPAGILEVVSEIRIPDGAHDLTITGNKTVLHASPSFKGRAILSCKGCRNIAFRDFAIDGNRDRLEARLPLPPSDRSFASFYRNNGILIEETDGVKIERVDFTNITNFAVLASQCAHVTIDRARVEDSGSRNANGRNNSTGGILFEEGAGVFDVTNSTFRNIRGNAVWTHSRHGSPRNHDGKIADNTFAEIGRDAIQIGHATKIQVLRNTGSRIGFPSGLVDVEGGAIPVGIDTAGNVDATVYENNRFEEINGKCIDLDGFHDGAVRSNKCVNRGKPEDYAFGHFGIVFNNANIDMQSQNVVVEGNQIEGMKFGGIFLIGSGHKILRNRMHRLNTAHCNENKAQFGCSVLGEVHVLESGIYIGGHAERPAAARNNTIEGNTIGGWKMSVRCVEAGPGVKLSDNIVRNNHCIDE